MKPRALNDKINAGVALALIAFLGLSGGLVIFSLLWLQASRQESRAARISAQLEQVLLLTLDIETGQRGFVLTGQEEYLEPYVLAIAKIGDTHNELRHLIEDPQQQLWLKQLEPLTARRIRLAQQVIEARKKKGFTAARQQILSNQGRKNQEQIRALIAQMQQQQELLLAGRTDKARLIATATIAAAIAGMILAPVLIVYQMRLLRQKELQASQAEADLRQANKQLEATNQDLEDFTYIASHDLKTPLRGISGLVTILKRQINDKLNPREQSLLDQIVQDCEYALRLVDDILLYSRIGQLQEPPQLVNINQLLSEVVAHLESEIHKAQASILWGNLPHVWADPVQLTQVFENLIGNALKYRSPDHPPIISIAAESTPDEWIFSVQDNGIGIDPDDQPQLFTMFKRLHSQGDYEGTGIGLAIVKKIAMRHGGRAWVESQGTGCGSTFLFTLHR